MPNKAKSKRKPARSTKSSNKQTKTKSKSSSLVSPRLTERICALNDPFCPAARGVKYYDNSPIRTIPFTYHTRMAVISDVNGNSSTLFLPGFNYFIAPGVVTSPPTAVYASALATNAFANVSTYRIVNIGLIVRGITTPLSASGMVRIRTFSARTGTSLTSIDTSTYNCDHYTDIPLSQCREVPIVFPRNDPTVKNWRTPSETNPTANLIDWVSPGFSVVQVAVVGGPATTSSIDIEIIINYEFTLADNDGAMMLATKAAKYNGVMDSISEEVSSTMEYVSTVGVKALGGGIRAAAAFALSKALSSRVSAPMIRDMD